MGAAGSAPIETILVRGRPSDPLGFFSTKVKSGEGGPEQRVWCLLDITPFGRQEEWQDAPEGVPQDPTIAVGATQTTGNTTAAHFEGPPKALTDKLFAQSALPTADAIGLNKTEFYSSQYFTLFPRVLRMDSSDGWTFCGRMPKPPGGWDSLAPLLASGRADRLAGLRIRGAEAGSP